MSLMDKVIEDLKRESENEKVEELFLKIIGVNEEATRIENQCRKKVNIDKAELKSLIRNQEFLLVYLKRILNLLERVFFVENINRIKTELNVIDDFEMEDDTL